MGHASSDDSLHVTPSGLYAYGGDLGEFALALSVLEHVAQRQVGQAETTRLLEAWLHTLGQQGGGFGACIDATAAAALSAAVGLGGEPLDLANPPEEARPALMMRLVSPSAQKWAVRSEVSVKQCAMRAMVFLRVRQQSQDWQVPQRICSACENSLFKPPTAP